MGASLINWSPIATLLLVALVVAGLPLMWLAWRWRDTGAGTRLRMMVALTLFLTMDLIVVGAFTRLTDSGLGCPDWPGCYGSASPWGAAGSIARAQAELPTGPVTFSKAWIEMVHRYFASGVGALILATLVLRFAWRRQLAATIANATRGAGLAWASLVLVWVCIQGAFGAWTVTLRLFPAVVTLHLLGALVLVALLRVQHQAYARLAGASASTVAVWAGETGNEGAGLRRLAAWALGMVFVQAALGAWVSSNYAVLACSEYPTCHGGQWWPAADFRAGFEWWRPLGQTATGAALPAQALVAIHLVHRWFAVAVVVILLILIGRLRISPKPIHRKGAWLLGALLVAQVITGLGNVLFGWPLLAALVHTAGAAALVLVLVGMATS